MKEILFRGKRIDNGEWIQGFFVIHGDDYYIAPDINAYTSMGGRGKGRCMMFGHYYQVLSETVGQYTGLTDKNGKKIFEGDIIKGNFSNYVIWADETERAFVYGKSYKGGYKNLMSDYLLKLSFPNGMEVIGNIHDNPELLEVKK